MKAGPKKSLKSLAVGSRNDGRWVSLAAGKHLNNLIAGDVGSKGLGYSLLKAPKKHDALRRLFD